MKTATLSSILATRARATFSYRINFLKSTNSTWVRMEEWCEKNCEDLWRSHDQFNYYFQFASEKDATMFMLRWGTAEGNEIAR